MASQETEVKECRPGLDNFSNSKWVKPGNIINHTLQTHTRHHEEETRNTYSHKT